MAVYSGAVDQRERERRLRLRFGPPVEDAGPDADPVRPGRGRALRWPLGVGVPVLLLATAAGAFLALTPHDHVAPGCWWWTAGEAGAVVPAERGCLRGWYQSGGEITEAANPSSFGVAVAYADPDQPVRRPACPFGKGDAVVVRYHAVFDDGRTIAVIEDCR